ncbi:MAG: RES family NAD+ phosphorylase [Bryobacteraceae bacterium]
MRIVRLCKRDYPNLDGGGSAITGGRWNSPGKQMVYTASCSALAVLEYMAHLQTLPKNMTLLLVEVPDTLKIRDTTWAPAEIASSRQIGDEWLESKETAVLRVPSVIVPRQTNYLLNPDHPLFEAIQVVETTPFAFDSRLLSAVSAS